jgi:hypothetical protein
MLFSFSALLIQGTSPDDLEVQLLAAGGPKTVATKCEDVRLHDDKTTYTGVYAKGGPTNVDGAQDISQLCDRSPANVRGMTTTYGQSH